MDVIINYDGLGNQMSRYALFLNKKHKGHKVKCINFNTDHNGIEIDRVFGVDTHANFVDILLKSIYIMLWLEQWKHIANPVKKILAKFGIKIVYENLNFTFRKEVLEETTGGITFYIGAWFNPIYFSEIADIVQSRYQFPLLDEHNNEIVSFATDSRAVAVHVRGGDYITGGNYNIFGSVCTEKYYHNAMTYIENIIPNPIYYVFTNDVNLAKKFLNGKEYVLVTHNRGLNSWKDMALMSKFKNIIIPNSSFSWWAAYLGQKDKRIIRPPVFMNGNVTSNEIYPKEWIKIDNV